MSQFRIVATSMSEEHARRSEEPLREAVIGDEKRLSVAVVVPIGSLVPGYSPRVTGEDLDHILKLAESDATLPPILVHRPTMRVIDGMHRLRAAAHRGESNVRVRFFDGDEQSAFVLAVRMNATHGLPLTSADRAAAVRRIVRSHPQWSDRAIASATGISAKTVASVRRCSTEESAQSNTRLGLDGRMRPVNAAEGRLRASELMANHPGASLREIASCAGISLSTAQNVRKRLRGGLDPVPRQRRAARPGGTRDENSDRKPAQVPERETIADHDALSSNLRRDPSLRLNEAGRLLLRLLEMHSMPSEEWQRLAEVVPAHWLNAVSMIGGECADGWHQFVKRLQRRLDASA